MKVFRNEQVHLRQTSLFSNSKVQNNGSTVPMMDDPVAKIEIILFIFQLATGSISFEEA
jgi:hypothetical protein